MLLIRSKNRNGNLSWFPPPPHGKHSHTLTKTKGKVVWPRSCKELKQSSPKEREVLEGKASTGRPYWVLVPLGIIPDSWSPRKSGDAPSPPLISRPLSLALGAIKNVTLHGNALDWRNSVEPALRVSLFSTLFSFLGA